MKKLVGGVLLLLVFSLGPDAVLAQMFQTVGAENAQLLQTGTGKLYCPACGMNLIKFYKTSHARVQDDGAIHQYCSLHCLLNTNKALDGAQVVDVETLAFIPADSAFYVVGSSKKGTMSMTSKYAFGTRDAAENFIGKFGGSVMDFPSAVALARGALEKENAMIQKKRIKAAQKGQKIAEAMCGDTAFPHFSSIAEAKAFLAAGGGCGTLTDDQYQALAVFLVLKDGPQSPLGVIQVPKDAKCPVCGMFCSKYPQWVARVETSGGDFYYFDGVKDMMKWIFHPGKYSSGLSSKDILKIQISDYYSLGVYDAAASWFVKGSNVYGPMGDELIPFKSQEDAVAFMKDHFGDQVLSYQEITEDLIWNLDK